MPGAAFCGLRHSESDVYFVKPTAIGIAPSHTRHVKKRDDRLGTFWNRIFPRSRTFLQLIIKERYFFFPPPNCLAYSGLSPRFSGVGAICSGSIPAAGSVVPPQPATTVRTEPRKRNWSALFNKRMSRSLQSGGNNIGITRTLHIAERCDGENTLVGRA